MFGGLQHRTERKAADCGILTGARVLLPRFDRAGKLVAEAAVAQKPTQLASRISGGSRGRRRGDIVTIALVPAGAPPRPGSPIRQSTSYQPNVEKALVSRTGAHCGGCGWGRPQSLCIQEEGSWAGVGAGVAPGAGAARGSPASDSGCSRTGPGGAAAASSAATQQLGLALRDSLAALFGPTLHLTSSTLEAMFPTAFERMASAFYRSKITSWMAAQEEDYRRACTPLSGVCFVHGAHAAMCSAPRLSGRDWMGWSASRMLQQSPAALDANCLRFKTACCFSFRSLGWKALDEMLRHSWRCIRRAVARGSESAVTRPPQVHSAGGGCGRHAVVPHLRQPGRLHAPGGGARSAARGGAAAPDPAPLTAACSDAGGVASFAPLLISAWAHENLL